MVAVFVTGYACIAFEHTLGVNKAAVAIGMAALLWSMLLGFGADPHHLGEALIEQLSETSQIIFFLLGAMTLVEVIDAHGAFRVVTDRIRTRSIRGLLLAVGLLAFFMSSVLDNLTTTIVMVSLLRRMVPDREQRNLLGGFVVVAANAGGAWTPIGDVTTTMLWIGGQISTVGIMTKLVLPSFLSLVAAMAILSLGLKGDISGVASQEAEATEGMRHGAKRVLALGLAAFLLVPVLKSFLHIPPFLGIGFGLSMMWILTDLLHRDGHPGDHVRVPHALSRVDVASAFFFLGILLAVGALQTVGILGDLAKELARVTSHEPTIAAIIGIVSAIVDNVPLVAATMKMYPLSQVPLDDNLWSLIAYCAGTGGSLLIIGSAAGVALMGMEHITFGWYMRRITPAAMVAYFVGLAAAVWL